MIFLFLATMAFADSDVMPNCTPWPPNGTVYLDVPDNESKPVPCYSIFQNGKNNAPGDFDFDAGTKKLSLNNTKIAARLLDLQTQEQVLQKRSDALKTVIDAQIGK